MPLLFEFSDNALYAKHEVTAVPPCNAFYMHTHRQYELMHFISGDAAFIIEDRKYKLRAGDLILIRPSKYHFVEIESAVQYERYTVLFNEALLGTDERALISDDCEVINISSNAIMQDLFKKLDFYHARLSGKDFSVLLGALLKELFYNIKIERHTMAVSEADTLSPILSGALRYINQNLVTVTGISEIARALFVTESYLFRLFKQELHQTPKKYISDKRLIAANGMIAMGERPSFVYEKCGFVDYTTFYRAYKRFYGYAPSAQTAELHPRPEEDTKIEN